MPSFNVVIENTFLDVALRKSDGGMKDYEKDCFGIFTPRFNSLWFWPDYSCNIISDFTETGWYRHVDRKSGVCWYIFNISTCVHSGWHERYLSIERLPLMAAILIHGCILYFSYLGTYLINDWLERGVEPILVFSEIFVIGYLAVWVVIYSITKRNTEKLNKILREKQLK